MAKGWTMVGSNSVEYGDMRTKEEKRRDRVKQDRGFEKLIKHTERKSYDELVKATDKTYEKKVSQEMNLIEAFRQKKLKSKALIKKVKKLQKQREAAVAT